MKAAAAHIFLILFLIHVFLCTVSAHEVSVDEIL